MSKTFKAPDSLVLTACHSISAGEVNKNVSKRESACHFDLKVWIWIYRPMWYDVLA